jgi:hypothetical protein
MACRYIRQQYVSGQHRNFRRPGLENRISVVNVTEEKKEAGANKCDGQLRNRGIYVALDSGQDVLLPEVSAWI